MFGRPSPWRPQSAQAIYLFCHKRRICNTCALHLHQHSPPASYILHIHKKQLLTMPIFSNWVKVPLSAQLFPFFCHLLLTGFPLIISEVAALTCRQLSLRLMATDRKNVPAKLAPTDSPILPPNERYLKEVPPDFAKSFHH